MRYPGPQRKIIQTACLSRPYKQYCCEMTQPVNNTLLLRTVWMSPSFFFCLCSLLLPKILNHFEIFMLLLFNIEILDSFIRHLTYLVDYVSRLKNISIFTWLILLKKVNIFVVGFKWWTETRILFEFLFPWPIIYTGNSVRHLQTTQKS